MKLKEEYALNAVKAILADLNPNDLLAVENLASKLRAQLRYKEEYEPSILALKLVSAEWDLYRAKWESLPPCECGVCGMVYKHHCGSTPCCGSVAYILSN